MHWDDLRYILAIGRAGTLAAAARRLGVDQTTMSRRLAAAEAALGARLFERIDGVLSPTEAGAAAIARASEVEAQVKSLEGGIGGSDTAPAGLVRLTAVPILVNRLIVPALPSFVSTSPGITLELMAEPRNVSLSRREADIALRLSRPERGGSALAKRIGKLDYAVYGPEGRSADQLAWIGYEEGLRHLPQARWIAAASAAGKAAPLAANDAETILQAIRAGLGKSLLPCRIADWDEGLRRLEPDVVLSREVWLLTHRELRHHGRIAAAIDWLQQLFRGESPQRSSR